MKKLFILLLVLSMACAVLPAAADTGVTGVWYLTSLLDTSPSEADVYLKLTVSQKGTFELIAQTADIVMSREGTWTQNENSLVLTIPGEEPAVFVVAGDTLQGFENDSLVMALGRQNPVKDIGEYGATVNYNGNAYYRITGEKTAACSGPVDSPSEAAVPDTIVYKGFTLKVTEIEENAFSKTGTLKTVTIGKNVKTIGKNAFASCPALKTVKGGAGITAIRAGAFASCKKLSAFPSLAKLQEIGANAFKACASLKSFTIGSKVTAIGKNAFSGCKALAKITVKSKKLTAKTVGDKAFSGISAKAKITCPDGKAKAYAKWLLKRGVPKTAVIK